MAVHEGCFRVPCPRWQVRKLCFCLHACAYFVAREKTHELRPRSSCQGCADSVGQQAVEGACLFGVKFKAGPRGGVLAHSPGGRLFVEFFFISDSQNRTEQAWTACLILLLILLIERVILSTRIQHRPRTTLLIGQPCSIADSSNARLSFPWPRSSGSAGCGCS